MSKVDTLMLDDNSDQPTVDRYTLLASLAVVRLMFTEAPWWQTVVRMSKDGKAISSAVLKLGGTTVEVGFRAVESLVVTIAGFGSIDLLANGYLKRINGETVPDLVMRREIEAARVVIDAAILRSSNWLTSK